VSIEFVDLKREKQNKKVVMNIEQNTKHIARATQVERQVEKKAHTRHRLIDTGKQTIQPAKFFLLGP